MISECESKPHAYISSAQNGICNGRLANLVEEFQSRWSIMPNPARDHVTVVYDGATAQWGIYDQLGREVRTLRVAAGQSTIDLSDLAPGTYLIGPVNGPKQRLSRVR